MPQTDPPPHSPELAHRLLHGLHLEWTEARDGNADPGIRGLHPPLFALHEGQGSLAHWTNRRREISFNRDFLFHHPWDAVREVLLHEMAHQVACELLDAEGQPPHGPAFRTACELLGANPKASGSYPTLRERLAMGDAASEDALTRRIQKLFALARSNNPHESEAALAKARTLVAKHQLKAIESGPCPDDYTSLFLGNPALRHHREYYALANLLTEHYFVRCIWTMAYVVDKGKMGRALEVSGARSHVVAAEYLYHFILDFIDRSWAEVQRERKEKLGRFRKSDFAVGIVAGFSEKLRREKKKSKESLLPALVTDPGLTAYIGRRYPRLVRRTRRGRKVDAELLNRGKETGKRMTLRPGLDAKRAPGGTLLTE